MDKQKKSLLIGLILGGGHLNARSGVCLEIEHGAKQKFYLEYKCALISKLLNCKIPNIYHNTTKNTYKLSKGHKYFKILYNWIYKNRQKVFSRKLLNKLNPEAIAIWWMDDGSHSVCRRKTTGKIMSHSFHFYTYTNKEDTQNIIDYFYETYNIKFYPIKQIMKDNSIKYYLKCKTREGRKFCDLIRPYILPQFAYKILNVGE